MEANYKISVQVGQFTHYFFKNGNLFVPKRTKLPSKVQKIIKKAKLKVDGLVKELDWSVLDLIDPVFRPEVCQDLVDEAKKERASKFRVAYEEFLFSRVFKNVRLTAFKDEKLDEAAKLISLVRDQVVADDDGFGFSLVLAKTRNKKKHSENGNTQENFSCAYNEMRMSRTPVQGDFKIDMEGPSHDPKFLIKSTLKFNDYVFEIPDLSNCKTKVECRELFLKGVMIYLVKQKVKFPLWVHELVKAAEEDRSFTTYKIPKLSSSIKYRNEEIIIIEFKQNRITVPVSYFRETDSFYYLDFKDISEKDRLLNFISKNNNVFSSNDGFKITFASSQPLPLARTYSNHVDFKPELRAIFALDRKFEEQIVETEGAIGVYNNLKFAPRNAIRIRFNKVWYLGSSFPIKILNEFLVSIRKQEFTKDNLLRTAAIAASLKMFAIESTSFMETIAQFSNLYMSFIRLLKETHSVVLNFDVDESWKEIKYFKVIVPMPKLRYSTANDLLINRKFLYPSTIPSIELINRMFTFPKFDITKTKEEVIKDICTQTYVILNPDVKHIQFRFSATNVERTLYNDPPKLNEYEEFLQALVNNRLFDNNLVTSMGFALRKVKSRIIFDELAIKMFSMNFLDSWAPTFKNMMNSSVNEGNVVDYLESADKFSYMCKYFEVERNICHKAQIEYFTWAKIFGIDTSAKVFLQEDYLLTMVELRRDSPEHCMFESAKQAIKTTYKEVMETKETMADINVFWRNHKDRLSELLTKCDSSYAGTLDNMNFDTIAGSVGSIKQFVNFSFNLVLKKICSFVSLDIDKTVDATTLLFYYMTWKNTNSSYVKMVILLDLFTEMGLADLLLKFLKILWKLLKKAVNSTEHVMKDEDFDKMLDRMNSSYEKELASNQKQMQDAESEFINSEQEESSLAGILKHLETYSKYAMGLSGIALLTALAIPTNGYCNLKVGSTIVSTAKNLTILTAGVVAIPKVFNYATAVFKWVLDQIKGLVYNKHVTRIQLNAKAENWLLDTAHYTPSVGYSLVRYPELCLEYLRLYERAKEFRARELDLETNVLLAFRNRYREFVVFYEPVRTAVFSSFGLMEMMHIQLCGDPGVGKTDLADSILKTVKEAYAIAGLDLGSFNEKSKAFAYAEMSNIVGSFGDSYNMNETLSHMDGYFGQSFIRMDDTNMFRSLDPDKFVNQILMLSGAAAIAPQADLASKGRTITAKFMVSNTNAPFIKPDGMECPEALWRRRQLFKITVKPEFLEDGKLMSDEKLTKQFERTGLNRTKGDHLLISHVSSTDDTFGKKPIVKDMTVSQFLRYVTLLVKKHYAKEMNRSLVKDSRKAIIRYNLENFSDQILLKEKPDFEKSIARLITDVKDLRVQSFKDYNLTPEAQAEKEINQGMEKLQKLWTRTSMEDPIPFLYNPDASTSVNSYNYVLKSEKVAEKFVYFLAASTSSSLLTDKECDVSNIKYDEKLTSYVYEATNILNPEDSLKVLSTLVKVNNYSDDARDHFFKYRLVDKNSLAFIKKVKLEYKEIVINIKKALGSTARIIANFIVDWIGKPILTGLITAVSLLGMFYSVQFLVDSLSTPVETAYTKTLKPINIPIAVSQNTQNFRTTALRNTFLITVGTSTFTAIGVQGNVFLANVHSFKDIDKNTPGKARDISTGNTIDIHIDPDKIRKLQTNKGREVDAVLFTASNLRATKTITHLFVSEYDVEKLEDLRYSHVFANTLSNDFESQFGDLRIPTPREVNSCKHPHTRSLLVDFRVERGDSGTLAYHDNTKLSGPFLGIISARSDIGSFVSVITKEELLRTLECFRHEEKIQIDLLNTEHVSSHKLSEVFKYNQVIKKSPYPDQSISPSSGFAKTPIHGAFPCDTQPAIQSENDPRFDKDKRHFLEVSLNKTSGTNQAKFDLEEEKFMKNGLMALYREFIPDIDKVRIYNVAQSITGAKTPGSTPMDLSTCPGLEYKLHPKSKGKAPFITIDENNFTYNISEKVYLDAHQYEELYVSGRVPQIPMLEFKKKELVKEDKILNPKTRTVGMGNFIHQIKYNQCFKDLHTRVKVCWNNERSIPFAMGVDPERHWHMIREHLTWDDYMFDMDVKAWEEKIDHRLLNMTTSVKIKILKEAYRVRNETFPEEFEKVAYGLAANYSYCDVAFEDILYEKRSGLLSGHPGTFMENSEIHAMIVILVIFRILKRKIPRLANISYILKNFKFILAADDIVLSISPEARNFVTAEDLVESYKSVGFELTAADKSAEIKPKTIFEVQFLKTMFQEIDGQTYPLPNMSIPNQLLNWYRTDTKLPPQEQIKINFQTAFRVLWWRGRETYEEYRSLINTLCIQNKVNFQFPISFEEYSTVMKFDLEERRIAEMNNPNILTSPNNEPGFRLADKFSHL